MKIASVFKSERTSLLLVLGGFCLMVFTISTFLWLDINFNLEKRVNSEKIGHFGDFIGGVVGSIWALAGVLLFYKALTEQRKDFATNKETLDLQVKALNQQIEEFQLQREELTSSRKVYEEQSRTFRIQQFESNFYSLLNVYLTIKKNLNSIGDKNDYFKNLHENLTTNYVSSTKIVDHHNFMVKKYSEMYNENRGHLSHYFKSFYRLVKIIDSNSKLNKAEKIFYSKILRSQLTDYEQSILYYNSHSVYGIKARALILKYNLLKHVPLFHKPEFQPFYIAQKNQNILQFGEQLNSFLIKHINTSYDIDSDLEKIEEDFEDFTCIVGIYFGENIEIKILCSKEIKNDGINLTDDEFTQFLFYFLYDRLVFSTYLDPGKVEITKFKTELEDSKIFGATITTTSKIILNHDKN